MRKLQFMSGIVIMAFGALICFGASKLQLGTFKAPGPGFLPIGYGALLVILTTIFLIRLGMRKGETEESAIPTKFFEGGKRVFYTFAAGLGYAYLVTSVGYLLCTTVLMAFLFWSKGSRKKIVATVGGFGVALITYIIFKKLFEIQLPSGFFGF